MNRFYEVKVKYDTNAGKGVDGVTEIYLIDAVSFTETEARIVEELKPYMAGDLDVLAIKRSNYREVIENKDDACDNEKNTYYAAKVNFVSFDEFGAKEKRTAIHYLVYAGSIEQTNKMLHEFMKGTLSDYEISKISETKIIDVIKRQ